MGSLSTGAVLRYAVGGVGQSVLPLLVGTWLIAFYTEQEHAYLLSAGVLGTVVMVERIFGAILEPLIGYASDRTASRFGRRRPWIAVGLPVLVVAYFMLWSPPAADGLNATSTIVWVAACFLFYNAAYTAVFAPYNALLPELHRATKERLRLSSWMGIFEVVGQIAVSVGGAALIGLGAVAWWGLSFSSGFAVLAAVAVAVTLVTMLPVVLFTREVSAEPAAGELGLVAALTASFANRHFVRYAVGLLGFRIATNLVLAGIPFVGVKLMGLTSAETSYVPAVIIVVAVLAFPVVQRLANRHGKARVFRWGGFGFVVLLPLMGLVDRLVLPPLAVGGVLFALSGFSVATLLVLPRALLADIVDHDETRTGLRREAIYTGMSGIFEKLGMALSAGIAGLMLELFGQTSGNLLGVRLLGVAGSVVLALSLAVFRRYDLAPTEA
ncbi:MAG: MFS transporter [Deltaproteobacteria bacterium]